MHVDFRYLVPGTWYHLDVYGVPVYDRRGEGYPERNTPLDYLLLVQLLLELFVCFLLLLTLPRPALWVVELGSR